MTVFEAGTQLITTKLSEECKPTTIPMPSWNRLLADLAKIIREDNMYPEEMPWECFDVVPMGCYNFY